MTATHPTKLQQVQALVRERDRTRRPVPWDASIAVSRPTLAELRYWYAEDAPHGDRATIMEWLLDRALKALGATP